ncbi:MAG: aspartate aminotransferase family protein [Alphaproteobacteria bacterium]|nr:aspartate aminotransferase family protein [Alphaproteobacteria bacterium]
MTASAPVGHNRPSDFPVILPVYKRSTIRMVRGEGVYLFDEEGRQYLDFAAGIAVNSLGHCHPHLVKALQEQAATLWHTSNLYTSSAQEKLAARLVEQTCADSVFFCSTGLEASECAIKMVRKYFDEKGEPEKYRIITLEGSFHGRSIATISAAGKEKLTKGFAPLLDGFDQVPMGDIQALRAKITPFTAAIMLEPILGEGGVIPCPPEYLRELRAIADAFGLLLVFDEVQCGYGRPGALFYHQMVGVEPDIITAAKGIGSGFPLAACLAKKHVAEIMTPGSHGSTYGGNPLAMAVGNAVLDVILKPGFFEHVQARGKELYEGLEALVKKYPKLLAEARGVGLMLGLKTVIPNMDVVVALREQGLLTVLADDNVIRILPPLIIEKAHIAEALDKIEVALQRLGGAA